MKTYSKTDATSYTLGAFPTFELLKNRPQTVREILFHDKLIVNYQINALFVLAKSLNIPVTNNSKLVEKLANKENTFIIGVFDKYDCQLNPSANHIALVHPSDMGNLGTIFRASLGFNYRDVAIIGEHADYFNPKVVRASMGAIFSLNVCHFDSYEQYTEAYARQSYPFMLVDNAAPLTSLIKVATPHTLVFGNEATGLPHEFASIGQPVVISHSDSIDSLNLPTAVGIGLFYFDSHK